eukprot:13255725-Ditylum_brightwellii.AAC.2
MENEAHSDDDDDEDEEMKDSESKGPQRLIASVAGTVDRVNKLISVIPTSSSLYVGQVGDLIIGRIAAVTANRWKVSLTGTPTNTSSLREGHLPLSGVNLPGGVQRIRTSEDALAMRTLFSEGDLLSAEVQNVQHDGTLLLHTRSFKYGKLENGVLVTVPPALVPRRKIHMVTLDECGVDVLLGMNGCIWIQRSLPNVTKSNEDENAMSSTTQTTATTNIDDEDPDRPLAETLQRLRQQHALTPVTIKEREVIARVRNSVESLKMVYCKVTPETIRTVYKMSVKEEIKVGDMLRPDFVLKITEGTRSKK